MIDKSMKILDIVERFPDKEIIFKPYDEIAGKCIMCHHLFDTVEDLCKAYDIDEKELLGALNKI